ncbi:acyltransferase family protein [Micromonospora chokoriensis]|uniref:Peptidoglycan/LPS O-acetylase OafA/YrhL, contains acyltransferase and SGNH-hydrolase domains n=1 Tax=Micromonospora chokoriensis TaxID=356851 RepID=A0A1C4Y3H9_9ACTN|nr:acyltransferase [Micromonospora chokoriensis]SCF14941.1 Peptidoglycan/LPS O-acetylase OafA/YrhL, contains acyltransferase and SGNH-hydrolase domains [Micromonospora chokoriensis]
MTTPALIRSRGTLADLLSGRSNGIGLIRLCLAVGVVLSHSKPLGFGANDLGYHLTGRQTNVGTMAVYGFFVLSGLLITRSARRTGLIRYAWHRALRIFPGLWVCLLITALVVAPLVALREHGSTDGFFDNAWEPGGPLAYLQANWWTGVRQYGIHDLLRDTTPWGDKSNSSVFNGALWSLKYEMFCYVVVGVLAATAVLRNARRFVLFLTVALYLSILHDWVSSGQFSGPVSTASWSFNSPLVGGMSFHYIVYLGFLFAFGATLDLYRERVPINDALGIGSAVALGLSLLFGGFFVIGLPAFAYLLVWLSVRMPRQLHWVGRKNDYSYGIYIYGFVFQQVMASLGWSRWGYVPFAAMSVAAAFAAAFLSWKLVERPALRLKDWTPGFVARRSTPAVPPEQQTAVAEEPPGTPPTQVGGPTQELPQQPATLVPGR